ncbi:MAG: beta-1,6-N-acetylglucosaminyltransferase [Oscillospiraceae bacterium]|jgi:hypothetical protein|nr:beta-1,6-N-acetylglucosaminyltransferase [Oscillospiraceae bacterium]
MKIAYIILAHTDPAHIARLSKKLTVGTQHEVFLHIDKKADLSPFEQLLKGAERVHFVSPRTKVNWGGFSSVEATVKSFRFADEMADFDRFVLLQGLDYPIRSNTQITDFFERHKETEFIRAVNETHLNGRNKYKYCLYWNKDGKSLLSKAGTLFNQLLIKLKLVLPFKPLSVASNGADYDVYSGWAHFAITRSAVRYILDFYDSNPQFNRYFKSSFASDEAYFHTVLYNSPFALSTPEGGPLEQPQPSELLNVLYFEYPYYVKLFTKASEYPTLKNSGYLFFRKASSESEELLDIIDNEHGEV